MNVDFLKGFLKIANDWSLASRLSGLSPTRLAGAWNKAGVNAMKMGLGKPVGKIEDAAAESLLSKGNINEAISRVFSPASKTRNEFRAAKSVNKDPIRLKYLSQISGMAKAKRQAVSVVQPMLGN